MKSSRPSRMPGRKTQTPIWPTTCPSARPTSIPRCCASWFAWTWNTAGSVADRGRCKTTYIASQRFDKIAHCSPALRLRTFGCAGKQGSTRRPKLIASNSTSIPRAGPTPSASRTNRTRFPRRSPTVQRHPYRLPRACRATPTCSGRRPVRTSSFFVLCRPQGDQLRSTPGALRFPATSGTPRYSAICIDRTRLRQSDSRKP